jgi:CRISPR-associated exonuclease Cas4
MKMSTDWIDEKDEVTELPPMVRVIDLKQHAYCPRVAYYQLVLPRVRPLTYKMEAGIAHHKQAQRKERRRTLRAYGLRDGRRHFDVRLQANELGLSGELDMLIETKEELIPVDYKLSKKVASHFKLQIMTYARLLRATSLAEGKKVRRGFIYLIPSRKAREILLTAHLEQKLEQTLQRLREIIARQWFPPPARRQAQCVDCEFRRFCNDRL